MARKQRKTDKILNEAEYYTGVQTGQQSPETLSSYEYSRDNAPVLSKLANLKDQQPGGVNPQALPFPMQDAVLQLANLYLQTLDLKNKAATAANLPLFKGKEAELKKFRAKLAGIMVAYKELAAQLDNFTLAPK
jgi:hypothetical protein